MKLKIQNSDTCFSNAKKALKSITLIGFMLVLLSSCDYNRRTTGWDYAGDLIESRAYETYTENPVFKNGRTMQPPVEGTIPRGFMPYQFQKTDEDRALAAKTLVNNVENTPENIERGKVAFGIYCMQCHGEKADGQGSLYVNKKFNYPPGNLLNDKMRANPEADIYHVITVGWGIMGEHGSMIEPADRWKIAMYIKQELQK
ncbi:MAG: cytochrome c [Draconibacterium sp.]|nr:cytochrome c [Draconibacterium sp.]